MQQVSPGSSQTPPHLQLISARTLFAARPTEPPSSPPPTSPLPPLPETAPYGEQRSLSSFSEASRSGRPARPPRPTTSLQDLKPRTITSPEIYRRQRCTELAAQVKYSPNQPRSTVRSPSVQRPPKTPEHRNSIRLLTPTPQTTSTFSEDVLSALPKLFQRSPRQCLDTPVGSPLTSPNGTDRLRAWQVYHRSPTKSPSKSQKRKTDTKKPIARTALFIPRTPPASTDRIGIHPPSISEPLPEVTQSCYATQTRNTSTGTLFPPRRSSKSAHTGSPTRSTPPLSPSHKRSQAVTAFAFDFGNYYDSSQAGSHGSSDNLTSLPKLPSTPNVNDPSPLGHTASTKHHQYLCTTDASDHSKRPSTEDITFTSLPYAHTIHTAGPPPKTEHDLLNTDNTNTAQSTPSPHDSSTCSQPHLPRTLSRHVNFRSTDLEAAEEEEETREPTEEEIRNAKRKRWLWIISTISLVLVATAGILGGIISKLKVMAS